MQKKQFRQRNPAGVHKDLYYIDKREEKERNKSPKCLRDKQMIAMDQQILH